MVSFENFVKSMPPSLSELKVTPSFCFPFKIPDDPTATTKEQAFETIKQLNGKHLGGSEHGLKLKRIPRASQDINPSEK